MNNQRFDSFTTTQVINSILSNEVTIDDTHRLFYIGKEKDWKKSKQNPVVYSFDEVVSYSIEMIGQKVETKKKGGITRALVGGAIAGPAGALIGAGTAKSETKTTGGQQMSYLSIRTCLMRGQSLRKSLMRKRENY